MMHSIWMNMLLSCALTAPLWAAPLTKADEIKSLDQHISAQYASCPLGQVVDKASNTCVWCPAGKIGTGLGQFPFDCVPCDPDKYRPATQGTQCMTCPAGQVPNRDHSGCQECVGGFEPNSIRNNPDDYAKTPNSICVACPDGWVKHNGQLTCTPCNGRDVPNFARDKCETCPYPLEATNGTCVYVTCPDGHVKPKNQHTCTRCTGQQVANFARDACVTCPQGFEATSDNTHCTVCPGNKFRHGDWNIGCQVCDPAYNYSPFGWVPTEDHAFCESCAAGFESNLGKPLTYSEGPNTYTRIGIGDDCIPCPALQVREAGSLGGCHDCPYRQSPSLGQDYCR